MINNLKNQKRIIAILSLVLIIFNFLCVNISMGEFAVDKADLYSKGECGALLKKDGITIKTTLVVYNDGNKEYPAYCLNKEKAGVGECGDYTVSPTELLQNILVWRAITNGYPYKSPNELGCENEQEAFMATKMAVYSMIYGYSIDNFSPIGEPGNRTWNALNNIILASRNGSNNKISPNLKIIENEENWEIDNINNKFISRTFNVKPNGIMKKYSVDINGDILDGMQITNLENETQNEFDENSKFKILIPITELIKTGSFSINVKSEIETKPIFIGRSPDENKQDYAITGDTYEIGTGKLNLSYGKNETQIKIVKQDLETKLPLKGTKFELLDKNKKLLYSNLISDEKGEIILKNLMPGTYFIKEVEAIEGYKLYEEEIKVDVQFNQLFSVIVNNSKSNEEPKIEKNVTTEKVEISQKEVIQKKLPKTGM